MSTTTVAELRTALGVETLYADAVLQSVCDAADDVMLPFLWTNVLPATGHSNNGTAGVLYFNDYVEDVFYVGQKITVTGCGSNFNGSKTVNAVNGKSIDITTTHAANVVKTFHPIYPYGQVAATTYTDYSSKPAVQEASLMISVAIFQARQAPTGQGVSIDGYAPSPYTMSNVTQGTIRASISVWVTIIELLP